MGTTNLGKVRGNMWYTGDGVTGSSTTPAVFSGSGVTKAYIGDLYLHLKPNSVDNGHVYVCTKKGDASTAEWMYDGSILGPQPDLYDGLDSVSTQKAATANAARKLKKLIDDAGIYPMEILVDSDEVGYTMTLTIENISTTITITDTDGNTGVYNYTAVPDEEEETINISIGTDIGFADEGAVIKLVSSSSAAIKNLVINGYGGEIVNITPDLWESVRSLQDEIRPGATITGQGTGGTTYSYRTSQIYKLISDVLTQTFPVSHSKAIWMEEVNGNTVYDEIQGIYQKEFEDLYGLCTKTTVIGKNGDDNTEITETDTARDIEAVTTIVPTSSTVTTITTVVTPDEGDYVYTKTTVITKGADSTTIGESYTRAAKEE